MPRPRSSKSSRHVTISLPVQVKLQLCIELLSRDLWQVKKSSVAEEARYILFIWGSYLFIFTVSCPPKDLRQESPTEANIIMPSVLARHRLHYR